MNLHLHNQLSPHERSEYFRGLLLVMAADGKLDERELVNIREIGRRLDFAPEFIEESMHKILINEYVSKSAAVFDCRENAVDFVESAIAVAFADGHLAQEELNYIKETVKKNQLPLSFLHKCIEDARNNLQKTG